MDKISWRVKPYVELLQAGRLFSQANYGDGEWSAILGRVGCNCDGMRFDGVVGAALRQTLVEPRFTMFGTCPGPKLNEEVNEWLTAEGLNNFTIDPTVLTSARGSIKWIHKEMLPSANMRGDLGPLIAALRQRRVVLVGPDHLRLLDLFTVAEFIAVPPHSAFQVIEPIVEQTLEVILKAEPDIVLFSAGMATNVIMWRLAENVRLAVSMLDCGALWDPYVGVISRKGYRRPEWPAMMQKNIEGATKC